MSQIRRNEERTRRARILDHPPRKPDETERAGRVRTGNTSEIGQPLTGGERGRERERERGSQRRNEVNGDERRGRPAGVARRATADEPVPPGRTPFGILRSSSWWHRLVGHPRVARVPAGRPSSSLNLRYLRSFVCELRFLRCELRELDLRSWHVAIESPRTEPAVGIRLELDLMAAVLGAAVVGPQQIDEHGSARRGARNADRARLGGEVVQHDQRMPPPRRTASPALACIRVEDPPVAPADLRALPAACGSCARSS